MEPFFLVWNPNGGSPSFRHPNVQSAKTEAKRLAELNPQDSFFVLEALGVFSAKPVVQVQWTESINMPF